VSSPDAVPHPDASASSLPRNTSTLGPRLPTWRGTSPHCCWATGSQRCYRQLRSCVGWRSRAEPCWPAGPISRRTASLLIGSDNGAGAPPRTPSACAVLRPRAQRVGESAHPHPTLAALSELPRGSTWAEPRDPLGFGLPLHELAACAKREATIVNDGPPMVGLPIVQVPRGPQRRKLDQP
jgi:hypothetical protein